jgi:TolA protein
VQEKAMKGSVITSIVLHGLLLAWLLASFSAARPLEVTAGEALPVELVTDTSQLQEGAKDAPKKDQAAKEITKNEPKVDDAKNSGDNDFDLKSVPTPMDRPSNVQKAAAAKKSDVVAPQDTAEQKSDDNVKEDTAVDPNTEVAALEKPVVDVKPEPRPDVKPVGDKPTEEAKDEPLPDAVPIPTTRPKEEPKKVEEKKEEPKKVEEKKEDKKEAKVADAKTDKDKKAKKDKENKKAKKSTTSKDSDFNANEIAELLNKVDNNPGGARRNNRDKAAGALTTNSTAAKMSQSEMDALRGMIEKNWSIMPGQVSSNDIVITVKFQLDQDGNIVGEPEVSGKGGDGSPLSALEGGALRAVKKSAPFDQLPKEKYDTWKVVTVNFNPSDLM